MQFNILKSTSILAAALAATATAAPTAAPGLSPRQTGNSALSLFMYDAPEFCDGSSDFLRIIINEVCNPFPNVPFPTFSFQNVAIQPDCRVVFSTSPTCNTADVVFDVVPGECHSSGRLPGGQLHSMLFCS